jgi:phage head maturation protease
MLVAPYDNSLCNLGGGLFERYEKNCFSQGLNGDPAILVNHNEEKILGLKSAGTARFWESSDGLHAEANDVPNTTFGSDALESVRRLEYKRASAAFWIISARLEHRGSDRIRVVERAVLRDASVLAFAAYLNTSSQLLQLPAAASALSSGPFAVQKAKLALLGLR